MAGRFDVKSMVDDRGDYSDDDSTEYSAIDSAEYADVIENVSHGLGNSSGSSSSRFGTMNGTGNGTVRGSLGEAERAKGKLESHYGDDVYASVGEGRRRQMQVRNGPAGAPDTVRPRSASPSLSSSAKTSGSRFWTQR